MMMKKQCILAVLLIFTVHSFSRDSDYSKNNVISGGIKLTNFDVAYNRILSKHLNLEANLGYFPKGYTYTQGILILFTEYLPSQRQ